MSETLVIGAAGLLGSRVVEALGEDRCIRASRNSGERVDISDPKSLASPFGRVGLWTESSAPAARRASNPGSR
ncbi:MAG: hypothetical protein WAK41_04830 [Roseiarcus sp.]|uniref:hypothetical protein n=1 Tax=Roseiarcus sp. TaxID=1969460 RepID=UPI003BB0D588